MRLKKCVYLEALKINKTCSDIIFNLTRHDGDNFHADIRYGSLRQERFVPMNSNRD